MIHHCTRLSLPVLLLAGSAVTAFAQSSTELAPLQVTTTRISKPVAEESQSLTVVPEEEVLREAPRTPAEALRHKPGIWVQRTGHLGGAPIIRGFMGNRVLYLFDGFRQNTAALFGGPNSHLQNIDVLDVDRIEVVRGPGSVLYGSDAIGGVVDVTTIETPVFSDTETVGGRSYLRYATADEEKSGRQEVFYSSPKLYIFGGVSARNIEDVRTGDGNEAAPSHFRERAGDLQMDYLLAPGHRVQASAQVFDRPEGTRFDKPNRIQENERQLYSLRYFGEDVGVADEVKASVYSHRQDDFTDDRNWDSKSEKRTYGGELQANTYLEGGHRLAYGAHFHMDNVTSEDPQSGTAEPEVDWYNPALFALSEWQVTERLRFDAGVRWDYTRLESTSPAFSRLPRDIQEAILAGSFSPSDLELEEENHAVTGGVGLVYELTDAVNWVAHAGRAFRAPNQSDMMSFGQFTYGFNVPAGDLDPESSWTFETGLKTGTSMFSGEVLGYYTVLEDAIDSAPGRFNGSSWIDANGNGVRDPAEDVFVKRNVDGEVHVYGVDVAWDAYMPREWTEGLFANHPVSLYGNFSFIRGENEETDTPLSREFPMNGLVGLRIEDSRSTADRRWYGEVEVVLVDAMDADRIPDDRRTRDVAFKVDPQDGNSALLNGDGSVDGYALLHVRGGLRLREGVWLRMEVENATDAEYRVKDSRLDAPGVNLIASLDVRF